MKRCQSRGALLALLATTMLAAGASRPADACTRPFYVGDDTMVITGRNMDWEEDMASSPWILPAGMKRDGAAGSRSIAWTSRYGSAIVSGYKKGTTDGMNDKGLVANLLCPAESDYGAPERTGPLLSISIWAQFVLDNYATVAEAVEALHAEPFSMLAPPLPNGAAATLHLSISDATGGPPSSNMSRASSSSITARCFPARRAAPSLRRTRSPSCRRSRRRTSAHPAGAPGGGRQAACPSARPTLT